MSAHQAAPKPRHRFLTTAIAFGLLLAFSIPAFAGVDGQAGESPVYQCDLYPGEAPAEGAWGKATIKMTDDGYDYVVRVHGLTPGEGYELRSGGAFSPPADVVANDGGNAVFRGSTASIGAFFNIWIEPATSINDHRILRTAPNCTP